MLALSAWLVLRGGHAAKADSALVVDVKRGTLAIEILDTGRVEAREKIELKSKVAGQVVGVLAEEGARVKRGDTLVLLDPIDYEREVARAEAELSQAQATTHFAQQTLERKKSGVEQSILPSSDLDAASTVITDDVELTIP